MSPKPAINPSKITPNPPPNPHKSPQDPINDPKPRPQASELEVEHSGTPKTPPAPQDLVFGKFFTDHMLTVEWGRDGGWGRPKIRPFQELPLHPASSALHYAVEVSGDPRNTLKTP